MFGQHGRFNASKKACERRAQLKALWQGACRVAEWRRRATDGQGGAAAEQGGAAAGTYLVARRSSRGTASCRRPSTYVVRMRRTRACAPPLCPNSSPYIS
ncbi:hypothetical protein O3G_MSEX008600 [Manduca sexta]|uniref:Uncharacterized protein n=1 Tax=Manduca sexta TaxID=7130 RepID=A0A921ZAM0_MANSE|nr:hypothetical protein O3G_MSEX008600 [Manduca sexta]